MDIVRYLTLGIGAIGVGVITWGILVSLVEYIKLEVRRAKGTSICRDREMLRHHLGSSLLLGLEFLVAADVAHTIIEPSLAELAVLGSIVAIRTVLNYFLNKELATHQCGAE